MDSVVVVRGIPIVISKHLIQKSRNRLERSMFYLLLLHRILILYFESTEMRSSGH